MTEMKPTVTKTRRGYVSYRCGWCLSVAGCFEYSLMGPENEMFMLLTKEVRIEKNTRAIVCPVCRNESLVFPYIDSIDYELVSNCGLLYLNKVHCCIYPYTKKGSLNINYFICAPSCLSKLNTPIGCESERVLYKDGTWHYRTYLEHFDEFLFDSIEELLYALKLYGGFSYSDIKKNKYLTSGYRELN